MIYLDNAATTFPKPEAVYLAQDKAFRSLCANPGRAGHTMSLAASKIVLDTREALCALLQVHSPESILFGQNCTDMLNLAIKGYCKPGMEVVTSVWAHNSVLRPLHRLSEEGIIHLRIEKDLMNAISDSTDFVVSTHAGNVTGSIEPIEEIAALCHMKKAALLVDAAQTAGILPIYPEKWGIDMVAMPGHKALYGPQGTGVLYVRPGLDLTPLKEGGTGTSSHLLTQPEEWPERFESGTLNLPGIAALGQGVRYVLHHRSEIHAKEMFLSERLISGLLNIPSVMIYGSFLPFDRVGTVSFNLKGIPSASVAERLNDEGIFVRAGLHCAPLAHETLGTLTQGTVRVSLSGFNTEKDVDALLKQIQRIAYENASD